MLPVHRTMPLEQLSPQRSGLKAFPRFLKTQAPKKFCYPCFCCQSCSVTGLIIPMLQVGLWHSLNSFVDLSCNKEYLLQLLILLSFNINQKLSQQVACIIWKRLIIAGGKCIHTQRNRSWISLCPPHPPPKEGGGSGESILVLLLDLKSLLCFISVLLWGACC